MCEREGFTQPEKGMMLLSKETRAGLRITGEHKTLQLLLVSMISTRMLFISSLLHLLPVMSFVDQVQYLFTVPGVSVFLSNRLCQDIWRNFLDNKGSVGELMRTPQWLNFFTTLKHCG